MTDGWPQDWNQRIDGSECSMCRADRVDEDIYGIRVMHGRYTDASLQRADVQRGYCLVIWTGRHVNEPTELTDEEAAGYWGEVLAVARALIAHFQPLKMNYETLGNNTPHLHTHLLPRYADDPAPGRPFPLPVLTGTEPATDPKQLWSDADALRRLLGHATTVEK